MPWLIDYWRRDFFAGHVSVARLHLTLNGTINTVAANDHPCVATQKQTNDFTRAVGLVVHPGEPNVGRRRVVVAVTPVSHPLQ